MEQYFREAYIRDIGNRMPERCKVKVKQILSYRKVPNSEENEVL